MKAQNKFALLLVMVACSSLMAQSSLTAAVTTETPVPESSASGQTGTSGCLRLNFRQVPLDTVLDYLSEAAGFAIVLEVQPRGTVDVWSEQPLTKDEALELLNSVLLKNGYAAIRKGRILTIVNRDQAKTRALPVKLGASPESIPLTDGLVTQIVPVRFTEASQLLSVLQPLVSSQTTMTANESANTLVITDTQADIHRLAQIIQAVDSAAEDFTVVKIFHLLNSNSTEMADVISQLFPEQTSSQSGSSSAPLGGFPGGFPGGPGGGGPPEPGGFSSPGAADLSTVSSGSQARRLKSRAKVTAVADQRTQTLVVTASRDLMPQVESVVRQLDGNPSGKQGLAVYQLKSASANALAKVLQDAFQKNGTSNNRSTSTQTDILENRSTTQSQQNSTTAGTGRSSSGFGQGGFGQGGFGGSGGFSGGSGLQ